MPASIPDRYTLEVRLGRDGDIEEWLATDTSLDRPVLIRTVGPESTMERRSQFVAAVSDAAKTSHSHLARVFTVATVSGGAYAVSEWTGGATVADRVAADHPIDLPDFLPNAAGLAGALAVLHAAGAVHGDIDPSAISYSGAHPAKLGAFGRSPVADADGDVRALSAALETALTGAPPGGPPPSERVDGVPRAIDVILRSGQSGTLTADDLEKSLRAAPTPRPPQPESGPIPKRLLIAAITMVLVAVGLVVVGFFLSGGTALVIPTPTSQPNVSTTTTTAVTTTLAPGDVAVIEAGTLDPFGEGGENDQLVDNLIDGDQQTEWLTERYLDPLPLLKPGVGVTVSVRGSPDRLQLIGLTPETSFEIYWSSSLTETITDWERIAVATAAPSSTSIELPPRENGHWLVWLTDLPSREDGTYQAALAELAFLP
ncbi:MAG TPA: protein kinase [Acidimicrobiia bacterium]|nr:protein kinase [Acidimicrobiia bacterium]